MSLKTRLRLSIVVLVTLLVLAQCVISLRIAAEDKFRDATERSQSILAQVRHLVLVRVNEQAALVRPQPTSVQQLTALWQNIAARDETMAALLTRITAGSSAVVEILVCDAQGRVLVRDRTARSHGAGVLGHAERDRSMAALACVGQGLAGDVKDGLSLPARTDLLRLDAGCAA